VSLTTLVVPGLETTNDGSGGVTSATLPAEAKIVADGPRTRRVMGGEATREALTLMRVVP